MESGEEIVIFLSEFDYIILAKKQIFIDIKNFRNTIQMLNKI
jgi:hypothetical protein